MLWQLGDSLLISQIKKHSQWFEIFHEIRPIVKTGLCNYKQKMNLTPAFQDLIDKMISDSFFIIFQLPDVWNLNRHNFFSLFIFEIFPENSNIRNPRGNSDRRNIDIGILILFNRNNVG